MPDRRAVDLQDGGDPEQPPRPGGPRLALPARDQRGEHEHHGHREQQDPDRVQARASLARRVGRQQPRTVKNRVHWDVQGSTPDLLAAGATLLRARDDEIGWDQLVDVEGNVFCVFAPEDPEHREG